MQDMVAVLRDRGDSNIHYRDGLELFGEKDEPMLVGDPQCLVDNPPFIV